MLAKPRASAGKARLCVNVSLCKLSLSEYGPTLPRAAALKRAYSRSRASKREYLSKKKIDYFAEVIDWKIRS